LRLQECDEQQKLHNSSLSEPASVPQSGAERGEGEEHKKHKKHKKRIAFLLPLVLLVFLLRPLRRYRRLHEAGGISHELNELNELKAAALEGELLWYRGEAAEIGSTLEPISKISGIISR
jgi:hypothetical protein